MGIDINLLIGIDTMRLEKALSCLETQKTKTAFISLVVQYPECSIFWDPVDMEAWIEDDDILIKVCS